MSNYNPHDELTQAEALMLEQKEVEQRWAGATYKGLSGDDSAVVMAQASAVEPRFLRHKEVRKYWRGVMEHGDHNRAARDAGIFKDIIIWMQDTTSLDLPSLTRLILEQASLLSLSQQINGIAKAIAARDIEKSLELARGMAGEIPLTQEKGEPVITTWADIDRLLGPIEWDWSGWVARAMLTEVASEPGQGKSATVLRLVGCYTDGFDWPDGSPFEGETGAVVWCEAEAAQAINKERAKAWGISLDKVLNPLANPLDDFKLDNPEHCAALVHMAQREDVRLIVIDSLRGAHGQDENSSEVVSLINWLAALARDSGKPVILTHHLRKRGLYDGDGINVDRLRGSSAIVQAARLVWAIDYPDPYQKERKRLSVIKSNLGAFPDPIGLVIDGRGVHFGEAPEAPKTESVADQAADLLLAMLDSEPVRVGELEAAFKAQAISWISAKRAKKRLGIVSVKKEEGWFWSLPHKGQGRLLQ